MGEGEEELMVGGFQGPLMMLGGLQGSPEVHWSQMRCDAVGDRQKVS